MARGIDSEPAALGSGSFADRLRAGGRWGDVVLLSGLPLLLCGVHLLPGPVTQQFVLDLDNPTLTTALSSSYVHSGLEHLLGNVLTYLFIVPLLYALDTVSGNRDRFMRLFVVFVLVLPIPLAYFNAAIFGTGTSYGFSGSVLAFLATSPSLSLTIAATTSTSKRPTRSRWVPSSSVRR